MDVCGFSRDHSMVICLVSDGCTLHTYAYRTFSKCKILSRLMLCTVHHSIIFDYADGNCTKTNRINNFTLCTIANRSKLISIRWEIARPQKPQYIYRRGEWMPGWKAKNFMNALASSRYNEYVDDILSVSFIFHFGHDTVNFRTNNHPLNFCSANKFLGMSAGFWNFDYFLWLKFYWFLNTSYETKSFKMRWKSFYIRYFSILSI